MLCLDDVDAVAAGGSSVLDAKIDDDHFDIVFVLSVAVAKV